MSLYQQITAQRTAENLARIPRQWRRRVAGIHAQKLAEMDRLPARHFSVARRDEIENAAHAWLADTVARVDRLRVSVNLSDADLCELADKCARECMDLAGGEWLKTGEAIRARLARYVAGWGLPCPADDIDDGPAIARMTDSLWWRRGLRKAQARAIEAAAIHLGYVRRGAEIYASQATVERRTQQRKRNAETLADTRAVNLDTGDEFNLAELAARSVANPRIRRGELMTRIAGFEAAAVGLGHVAEFWTATTPSRMHKWRSAGRDRVEENPKYDGTTPREAQGYLSKCWARFRSAIHRRGLSIYGFRIAEPHHDGTPHWHLLVFSPALLSAGRAAVPRLRALFRRYFLADSKTERGARANRCEFKAIDAARGSAAGYIAKYVSKNIDGGGYEVQGDIEGRDSVVPTSRVEAWASTWGIRQFQQVGGPPVGVWRELRRLDDAGVYSELVDKARAAADCGTIKGHDETGAADNWRRYVELMGGPVLARAYRPLKLAKSEPGERFDYATAEVRRGVVSRYGDAAAPAVWGVWDVLEGEKFASVRYRWELKRGAGDGNGSSRGAGLVGAELARNEAAGGGGRNHSSAVLLGGGDGVAREGCGPAVKVGRVAVRGAVDCEVGPSFSAPWTRVNNCTRPFVPPPETEAERETWESWERMVNGGGIGGTGGSHNGCGASRVDEASGAATAGRGAVGGRGFGQVGRGFGEGG